MNNSRRQGWHRMGRAERLTDLLAEINATDEEAALLSAIVEDGGLSTEEAERLSENTLGRYALPYSVVPNFIIDQRERFVPAVTEEPSVVAAMGHAARLARHNGGFVTTIDPPHMIGQIEIVCEEPEKLAERIRDEHVRWLESLRGVDERLETAGGGPLAIETRVIPEHDSTRRLLIAELLVDVREAMGANAVNTYAERLAALWQDAYSIQVGPRILSNLCDRRLARAKVRIPSAAFSDEETVGNRIAMAIESACRFAESDSYRAATHNKGIMNGMDAVLVAFGQDWRAVEAGAHAFAAQSGAYRPLSIWRFCDGELCGELIVPLAVGLVGGAGRVQKLAAFSRRIAGIGTSAELAALAVSAGLANNLAALRALSQEGIQKGHMRLHRRSETGATGA